MVRDLVYNQYLYDSRQMKNNVKDQSLCSYSEALHLLHSSKDPFFLCLASKYAQWHIPLYDYDCKSDLANEKAVLEEKKRLLEHIYSIFNVFSLEGYLFETAHGYHVVLNKLMSWHDYLYSFTYMQCCEGFVAFTKKRGYACLRVSSKPNRPYDIRFLGYMAYDNKVSFLLPAIENFVKTHQHLASLVW